MELHLGIRYRSSGTTHYVRDAAGSVMGIYFDGILSEQPIYGSNRLGVR